MHCHSCVYTYSTLHGRYYVSSDTFSKACVRVFAVIVSSSGPSVPGTPGRTVHKSPLRASSTLFTAAHTGLKHTAHLMELVSEAPVSWAAL